jgi:hypothetical protein
MPEQFKGVFLVRHPHKAGKKTNNGVSIGKY